MKNFETSSTKLKNSLWFTSIKIISPGLLFKSDALFFHESKSKCIVIPHRNHPFSYCCKTKYIYQHFELMQLHNIFQVLKSEKSHFKCIKTLEFCAFSDYMLHYTLYLFGKGKAKNLTIFYPLKELWHPDIDATLLGIEIQK